MRFWTRERPEDPVEPAVVETSRTDLREALREAFEQGRKAERARHRGHPLIALLVFLVALIGAGMMYLAAREGSFTRGGELVDQKLANATGRSAPADGGQLASR